MVNRLAVQSYAIKHYVTDDMDRSQIVFQISDDFNETALLFLLFSANLN